MRTGIKTALIESERKVMPEKYIIEINGGQYDSIHTLKTMTSVNLEISWLRHLANRDDNVTVNGENIKIRGCDVVVKTIKTGRVELSVKI